MKKQPTPAKPAPAADTESHSYDWRQRLGGRPPKKQSPKCDKCAGKCSCK